MRVEQGTQPRPQDVDVLHPGAAQPFLKWAGGKRWLCKRFSHLFPTNFDRYVEPFLGSGAVFFYLRPQHASLSDANPDLIATYQALSSSWKDVYKSLRSHERHHSDEYYYIVRNQRPRTLVSRASRFIYLNRTCWNGLYRVNRNGIFNVPRGTKDTIILEDDDFAAVASVLGNADLKVGDFEATLSEAGADDFVFVDPPYTVAHNLNGFVKYNDSIFTWLDQIRLRDAVVNALDRGAKVLVTNADHDSLRELYRGIGAHLTLERPTIISGKTQGRRQTTELAIVGGYEAS